MDALKKGLFFWGVCHELTAWGLGLNLSAGVAINAALDGPLRKHGGSRRDFSWNPGGGQLILVCIILHERARWGMKVPKNSRRHGVLTWAEFGFPSAARHVQAATKNFVQISNGERNVVQTHAFFWQLEQEQIVVSTVGRASQKMASVGVGVRDREAQVLLIKG